MPKNAHYTTRAAERLRGMAMANAAAAAKALAFPDHAVDGAVVPRAQFVEHVRVASLEDEQGRLDGTVDPNTPTFLEGILDNYAPAAIPGKNGTMLRAESGLDAFLDLVQDARSDLYARHSLEEA